jgi:hypothetical protein
MNAPGSAAGVPIATGSFLGGTLIQKGVGSAAGAFTSFIMSTIGLVDWLDNSFSTPPPGCTK